MIRLFRDDRTRNALRFSTNIILILKVLKTKCVRNINISFENIISLFCSFVFCLEMITTHQFKKWVPIKSQLDLRSFRLFRYTLKSSEAKSLSFSYTGLNTFSSTCFPMFFIPIIPFIDLNGLILLQSYTFIAFTLK